MLVNTQGVSRGRGGKWIKNGSAGFLRDAKPSANHGMLPSRHQAIFSVIFRLGYCSLHLELKCALRNWLSVAITSGPRRAGGTAPPHTSGINKDAKSGQATDPIADLTDKGLFRTSSGGVWADNSIIAPGWASAALLPLFRFRLVTSAVCSSGTAGPLYWTCRTGVSS